MRSLSVTQPMPLALGSATISNWFRRQVPSAAFLTQNPNPLSLTSKVPSGTSEVRC